MCNLPGLVIIGQGPAGLAAASAFREKDADTPVTLISQEQYRGYSRPRLPEIVSGQAQSEQICLYREAWYRERRLELLLGETALSVDLTEKIVLTDSGRKLPFAKLIFAAGAHPMLPPISGIDQPAVMLLRTLEDALQLHQQAQNKSSALLIGGGLLGLEAGYALTRLGLQVKVIEIAQRLLPRQLDDESSDYLQNRLTKQGFEFFLGAKIQRVVTYPQQVSVELQEGRKLTADLALVSAGIRPRTELAQAAGIRLGNRGIWVDDQLRTSEPGIWAAGDVAEWHDQVAGLWSVAQAMGKVAGHNAAGGHETYGGMVLATKLKVAGIDLWSQGNIQAEGAVVIAKRSPEKGELVKLFLRDQQVAGSIHLGDIRGVQAVKQLIESRLVVAGYEDRLLAEDFDYHTIPGFKT